MRNARARQVKSSQVAAVAYEMCVWHVLHERANLQGTQRERGNKREREREEERQGDRQTAYATLALGLATATGSSRDMSHVKWHFRAFVN